MFFCKICIWFKSRSKKANANLIISRKDIDLDEEKFNKLDAIKKKGTDENKSIYQIKIEKKDIINKSITTLYRYVNNGCLKTTLLILTFGISLLILITILALWST